jgi:O-succinylbenzoic acid--CoA ligase
VELLSSTGFRWLGRLDNVINSGGVKLHPEEIEAKLAQHLSGSFFVTSKPDDLLGSRLVLVIEGNQHVPDMSILSGHQRPKEIIRLEKFERTETGKVKRILP